MPDTQEKEIAEKHMWGEYGQRLEKPEFWIYFIWYLNILA